MNRSAVPIRLAGVFKSGATSRPERNSPRAVKLILIGPPSAAVKCCDPSLGRGVLSSQQPVALWIARLVKTLIVEEGGGRGGEGSLYERYLRAIGREKNPQTGILGELFIVKRRRSSAPGAPLFSGRFRAKLARFRSDAIIRRSPCINHPADRVCSNVFLGVVIFQSQA